VCAFDLFFNMYSVFRCIGVYM